MQFVAIRGMPRSVVGQVLPRLSMTSLRSSENGNVLGSSFSDISRLVRQRVVSAATAAVANKQIFSNCTIEEVNRLVVTNSRDFADIPVSYTWLLLEKPKG